MQDSEAIETRVEVTQADHEMAARYYCSRAMGGSKADELKRLIAREEAGDIDPLSFLFSRHRLAALSASPLPGREEIAGEREIALRLFLREDGGLRVTSDDVPGLILSHRDPVAVCADIWPALSTIRSLSTPPTEG